jgi:hypothetical protein
MVLPSLLPDTAAKVLGSYEQELHPAIERVLHDRFTVIVNIGCSDGYYAVGLGRRLSDARVFAFDLNKSYRAAAMRTAAVNAVAVTVREQCHQEELTRYCTEGRALVVCDCEGCEEQLVWPEFLPGATVLVELHPGTDILVPRRFAATHTVELIESQPRDANAYPELRGFPRAERELAVFERLLPQTWALLEPHAS